MIGAFLSKSRLISLRTKNVLFFKNENIISMFFSQPRRRNTAKLAREEVRSSRRFGRGSTVGGGPRTPGRERPDRAFPGRGDRLVAVKAKTDRVAAGCGGLDWPTTALRSLARHVPLLDRVGPLIERVRQRRRRQTRRP